MDAKEDSVKAGTMPPMQTSSLLQSFDAAQQVA